MQRIALVPQDTPVLHRVNKQLEGLPDPEIERLIPALIHTMHRHNGIGIAAPQVGLDMQLIVVNTKDDPLVLANPEITRRSLRTARDEEGCLSVPGVYGVVRRAQTVWVSGIDPRTGKPVSLKASGLFARVLQHETDHIHGTLFIDRTTTITQRAPQPAS
ncbi:MAG: peptide deformylase [Candidatus Kerfeldbacteria bacterium]|nr:peptide deformylase [Candidatus Kerfeldbacteria bacterium]